MLVSFRVTVLDCHNQTKNTASLGKGMEKRVKQNFLPCEVQREFSVFSQG